MLARIQKVTLDTFQNLCESSGVFLCEQQYMPCVGTGQEDSLLDMEN